MPLPRVSRATHHGISGRRRRLHAAVLAAALGAALVGLASGVTIGRSEPRPGVQVGLVSPAVFGGESLRAAIPGGSQRIAEAAARDTAPTGQAAPPQQGTTTAGRITQAAGALSGDGQPVEIASDEPPQPLFTVHIVQPGDTLSGVAAAHGLNVATLLANNPGLGSGDLITVGQQIRVPPVDGIIYDVRQNDTLIGIAQTFQSEADKIFNFKPNGLQERNLLFVGQTLLIPDGKLPLPPPSAPSPGQSPAPPGGGAVAPSPSQPPAPPRPPAPGTAWIWPVPGSVFGVGFGVVDSYHPRGHHGIDIHAGYGDPVRAVAYGRIVSAGYDSSWGNFVRIDHGGGIYSLYAHLSQIAVHEGQVVAQGQVIGRVGCTGWCFGPHLHFEVHRGAWHPVNPLGYLPGR